MRTAVSTTAIKGCPIMRLLVDMRNSTRVLGCKGTTRVQRCREGNVYGSRLRCNQKSWLLVLPTWVGFLQVVAKHQDEHVLQCSCFPPPRAAIAFEVDPQCQSACGRSGTFTSAPVGLWRKGNYYRSRWSCLSVAYSQR